ncbi:MAG: SDR family oxidoreductase [Gammaproteobacteria bacterium]|nr:SDR family oxidoreductase [Gammaproteobacteria bacterium]
MNKKNHILIKRKLQYEENHMPQPVAIITGAASGIGLASALRFADDYQLILSDISSEPLADLEKLLLQKGAAVSGVTSDISNEEHIQELVAKACDAGDIKALVHCAGLSPTMDRQGDKILQVNLIGTALLIEALSPHMKNGAVAVCIASQAGTFMQGELNPELGDLPENPLRDDFLSNIRAYRGEEWASEYAYSLSKLGVQLLVEKYALAWGQNNARIVSLSPGMVNTPMGLRENEHQPAMAELLKASPLGRFAQADEIAGTARFLCSADASFITGIDLLVDGGSTSSVKRQAAVPR